MNKNPKSQAGHLALQNMRRSNDVLHFELLDAKKTQILDAPTYEIQASLILQGAMETTYSRQIYSVEICLVN